MPPIKPKRTAYGYALWIALPMAQTSQVEGRLKLILDKTRNRRILPRRAVLIVLGFSAAVLVPLAILRPTAKAQASSETAEVQSAGNSRVQLVGVHDVNVHHTSLLWWKPNGLLLPNVVAGAATSSVDKDLFSSADLKNLSFAFRLPPNLDGETVTFVPSGSLAFYQKDVQRNVKSGSKWTLTASFPNSMKTTTIGVGIAASPWKEAAAHAPTRDAARVTTPQGNFIFSPVTWYKGNGWSVTITMSKLKQDWRIVAVDSQGRVVQPSGTGSTTTNGLLHLIPYFERSIPITKIKEFRVEMRPFVWTEFKNVALQPVK